MPDPADKRYVVRILPSAQRDFEELDHPVAERLAPVIRPLAEHPRPHGAIKLTAEEGHRLRVGVYRILYRIEDHAKTVFVYRIKHRREAYR